ncbi:hypothetical protein B0H13DRAFT_2545561 [Mycena leptocephala]|nr:hypothetical protein B0H13DRAFT_2545561 [Mycena leptocephala]
MAPIATVALLVRPDDLQVLYEGFVSHPSSPSNECRGDVLPHKASLAILHLAWTVTVRRWAGIDTFCVGGNYSRGVCYVHDRDIPHSALIQMNPETSLRELFHQLFGAMAADAPSVPRKVTSRSLGSYSATICLPRPVQKREATERLPQTSLHLEFCPPAGTTDQWLVHLHLEDSTEPSLTPAMGASMLHAFNQTLNSIVESPACSVDEVDMCSEHHFIRIRGFTKDISPFNNTLLHDLCLRHAKTQPDACAIDSWDGNLTYEELDDLTSRLAHYLVAQGVRPDTFVLCCFPKSTWAIVGRLAILKAGGAYISIDASDPPFYLESIIRRTQTRIMLTAPEYVARFQSLVSTVVEVTPAVLSSLPVKNGVACRDVRPDSPCLILFTSGSTGAPKGIIQEHRSYATAIGDYVAMLGLDASSRVLQFDDYAFDISNNDFLAPLTAGGCCCVPTPEKTIAALRENINALRVNMTFLTPTVAIQLGPRDMPTLKTVCIGGEPPSRDLIRDWAGHVRLINQYGMGEAATFCAYNDNLNADCNGIVGRAGSGALWIASPMSPEQLVPVGAVGEILIEGPHLARGYLDGVAAKSDVGFLSRPPAWMHRIHPHRGPTRVYRSGDLGRYHADGTVEHLGRKDTMLKLNGCRVESSEVECVLRRCLSDKDAVVVDVLGTMRTNEEPVLAAFVHVGSERKPGVNIGIQTIDEDHTEYPLVRGMRTIAKDQLPEYMIPSLFLLVDRIPRTKSNKTDRRRLHMYGQDFLRGEKILNRA